MYQYQGLEFIQIEDEEVRGLIYTEIGDRATLEQYPDQWFWASPKAEGMFAIYSVAPLFNRCIRYHSKNIPLN